MAREGQMHARPADIEGNRTKPRPLGAELPQAEKPFAEVRGENELEASDIKFVGGPSLNPEEYPLATDQESVDKFYNKLFTLNHLIQDVETRDFLESYPTQEKRNAIIEILKKRNQEIQKITADTEKKMDDINEEMAGLMTNKSLWFARFRLRKLKEKTQEKLKELEDKSTNIFLTMEKIKNLPETLDRARETLLTGLNDRKLLGDDLLNLPLDEEKLKQAFAKIMTIERRLRGVGKKRPLPSTEPLYPGENEMVTQTDLDAYMKKLDAYGEKIKTDAEKKKQPTAE